MRGRGNSDGLMLGKWERGGGVIDDSLALSLAVRRYGK